MKSFNKILLALFLGISFSVSANSVAVEEVETDNTLFVAMSSLAVVLMFVIWILAGVLKTTVRMKVTEAMKNKQSILLLLILPFSSLNAQEAVQPDLFTSTPIGGMHPAMFYTLFGVLLLEILVVLWLCLLILRMLSKAEVKSVGNVETAKVALNEPAAWQKFISRKILGVKPVESDSDVMLDHEYDGIRELDNDLPPWWKYGFYMTIISAVVYLIGFHLTGSFKLSEEEYLAEIETAEIAIAEYKANQAINIDESNAAFLDDDSKIAEGKILFEKTCATCHLASGGGQIGPNLTDEYWLYGNKPGDLFRTVSDGTSKGMSPWKSTYNPVQIQNIISYVRTLQGTKPENAKKPEGELMKYEAENNMTADSLSQNQTDTVVSLEVK